MHIRLLSVAIPRSTSSRSTSSRNLAQTVVPNCGSTMSPWRSYPCGTAPLPRCGSFPCTLAVGNARVYSVELSAVSHNNASTSPRGYDISRRTALQSQHTSRLISSHLISSHLIRAHHISSELIGINYNRQAGNRPCNRPHKGHLHANTAITAVHITPPALDNRHSPTR